MASGGNSSLLKVKDGQLASAMIFTRAHSNNKTRGGVAKRVFKPTIPATRRTTKSEDKDSDQNNSYNTSAPHGKVRGKGKDKEKPNKSKGKKDLIQLDATFNGINITSSAFKDEKAFISLGGSGISQIKHDRELRQNQTDGSGSAHDLKSINGIRIKSEDDFRAVDDFKGYEKDVKKIDNVEQDSETILKALYRDDFVSNRAFNEKEMVPIGWEHVSQYQVYKEKGYKKDVKPTTRFDKWASSKNQQDKMVLFQLPETVLKGSDGRLGKIRMYQSGKMELVDTRSGIVYDLLHTDCDVNSHPGGVDDDDDDNEDKNNDEAMEDPQENHKLSSTDWIKKEIEDDESANNQGFLPQIPSSSSSSKSRSSSNRNNKANHNYRDKCDKDEDNSDTDTSDDDDDDDDDERNIKQSYREAVTFDGNQIVCLGPISKNDLLIGRPKLDKFFNL